MLWELKISNLAILRECDLRFSPGLNIISGETGAGKTIIVNAIALIAGAKASLDMIGQQGEETVIEALFSGVEDERLMEILRETGVSWEDELIIRRVISKEGKGRSYINGRMVNLQVLQRLGQLLLSISGQHENQRLIKPENHVLILDEFGSLDEMRQRYNSLVGLYNVKSSQILKLREELEAKRRLAEQEHFAIREIEQAKLSQGEEDQLLEEKKRLHHAEEIKLALNQAREVLQGDRFSALWSLSEAIKALIKVSGYDSAIDRFVQDLEAIKNQVQDMAWELRALDDKIEADPQRLEACLQRLELIKRLCRKYGGSIQSVLSYLEELKEKAHATEALELELRYGETECSQLKEEILLKGLELRRARKGSAALMEEEVAKELSFLHMKNTLFKVNFLENTFGPEDQPPKDGLEEVEFLISTNPGEPLKPLARIASGGELSRITLALKVVLAKRRSLETIVFDEVDQGVSGATAAAVGEKIRELSKHVQVICITHLPQIASQGGAHFLVKKSQLQTGVETEIIELSQDERIMEVARLLGDRTVTPKAVERAKEMLEAYR